MIGAVTTNASEDQDDRDDPRGAHVELTGGDGAEPLGGVQPVGFGVVGVVEEVGAAGREAEADERDQRLQERVALVEHAGGGRRGEHEDVLGPLLGAGGLDDRLERRRSGATGGTSAGRPRRIRDRRHRCKGTGRVVVPPGRSHAPSPAKVSAVDSARMAPKIYTRKGDDGTTGLLYGGRVGEGLAGPDAYGAVDEAVSALGLARAETERGAELDELLIRLQRELFVVGAELATAPENRDKLTPGVSRTTDDMVAALEPIIDDVTDALRPADRVRAAGREPRRRRARPRAHDRAARRARGGRRRTATAGSTTATSCRT